jgi:ADP-ribose pyrophosphatase
MAHRLNAIDDEIQQCMDKLQSMGPSTPSTYNISSLFDDSRPVKFPLESKKNPVPAGHIKASGRVSKKDQERTPYKAKTNDLIERGDLSAESMQHYWPNYYCDTSLYCPVKPTWADTEDTKNIMFNSIDNGVDRTSHHGTYTLMPYIYENRIADFRFGKFPINPVGRTGIAGRGNLGRWGPNHAADPIMVTKRGTDIYFVCIQRKDTNEWALPGGMVELGDNVSITLRKEFGEEAMNTMDMTPEDQEATKKQLDTVFKNAQTVYKGYVDDPRNTDNAWMETVAMLIIVSSTIADTFKLRAGDDAGQVTWKKYSPEIKLYASHADLIKKAMELVA